MSIRAKFTIRQLLQGISNFENAGRRIRESIEHLYESDEERITEERARRVLSRSVKDELDWLLDNGDTKIFFEILKEYQKK